MLPTHLSTGSSAHDWPSLTDSDSNDYINSQFVLTHLSTGSCIHDRWTIIWSGELTWAVSKSSLAKASDTSIPYLLGRQKVFLKLQFGCLQMAEKYQKGNNYVIKDNDQSHHRHFAQNHLKLLFQCYL